VERFEKSQNVLAAIAFRAALPLSVTERLVNLVGDQVREHLINHHALSPETALSIALGPRNAPRWTWSTRPAGPPTCARSPPI